MRSTDCGWVMSWCVRVRTQCDMRLLSARCHWICLSGCVVDCDLTAVGSWSLHLERLCERALAMMVVVLVREHVEAERQGLVLERYAQAVWWVSHTL